MSQLADTLTSRDAVRRAVLDDIVGRCQIAAVAIEGGALDGIEVVSMGTLRDQVTAALLVDLPPVSDKYAEVTTPAHVVVSTVCPECRLPVDIGVKLAPRLTVESNSTELSVKAKSKAVAHMHGQQVLNVPEAQEDFGLDDVVGPVPPVEDLENLLLLVLPDELCKAVPSTVEMEGWSDLDKREAAAWAVAVHLVASDNDDVEIPARPEVIGGPPRDEGEADGGTPAEPDPDAPAGDDGHALNPDHIETAGVLDEPTSIDPESPKSGRRGSAQAAARPSPTLTADERIGTLVCQGSNHVPGHTAGCPRFGQS